MNPSLTTKIPGFQPVRSGKVREVYDLADSLLLVATDRISAFDVVMANGIPDKGRVLCQMSAFWFEMFSDVCPNHVISVDPREIGAAISVFQGTPFELSEFDLQGRSMLCKKARPLPIECVVRGYITGSLYKEYVANGPTVHGFEFPEGLIDCQILPEPIFTPATKAEEGHDQNLSEFEAANLIGKEIFQKVKDWSLAIYSKGAAHAQSKGILLADTKFEFGETDDGLIWIDEALTPDSSRFWPADSYDPGHQQPSFDKQFVRNYLESIPWDKTPPGPELPEQIVTQTRQKYIDAFERLTGRTLVL